MRNACGVILVAMVCFTVVAVAAFRFMEWWQALLTLLVMATFAAIALKYLAKTVVRTIGENALRMTEGTSKVLRGASVDVHHVTPADMPKDIFHEEDDEFLSTDDMEAIKEEREEMQSRAWYKIEMTVFPHPEIDTDGVGWDPEQLSFVPADAKLPENIMDLASEDSIEINKVKLLTEDQQPNEDGTYKGPQRLLVLAGFPYDVREVSLRYYQEQFGRIKLPNPKFRGLQ